MAKIRTRIVRLVGIVLLLSGSGAVGLHTSIQEPSGEELYEQLCSRCHGKRGGMGLGGIPKLKTSRISEALIKIRIQEGSGEDMPAFADSLTSAQLHAVAEYVINLRK